MKIVILDGHTVNPDDLSWEPFEAMGNVEVYARTPMGQVAERAKDAQAVLINKIKLGREEMDQLPNLKYIGLCATGFDNVDLQAAHEKGIVVTNIPSYGTPSVAQHAIALLLELSNRVGLHNKSVHESEWVRSADFSYFKAPIIELQDKKIGVLGYGAIGKQVAKIAGALGMQVLVHSAYASHMENGRLVTLEELFRQSDFLSIHAALNERTLGLVNHTMLSLMKPTAFVINTSRGAIINEQDLADHLNTSKIAGAALDVLSKEPPTADNPLLSAKNCIITPHCAWISHEARQRLLDIAVDNLKGFLGGDPRNVVKGD